MTGTPSSDGSPTGPSRMQRLLWGETETPRRGPKPGLTLQTIAETAVRTADEEGLDACTLSGLARKLGVTAMAFYRYIDSKSDLALLMVDAAYGKPTFSGSSAASWRTGLTEVAGATLRVLQAHPWLLQLPLDGPPVTPNTMAWLEEGLAALHGLAIGAQEKFSILLLLEVFVRGQAQLFSLYNATPGNSYGEQLQAAVGRLSLPHLTAAVQSPALDDNENPQAEFHRGLGVILDGIEARLKPPAAP